MSQSMEAKTRMKSRCIAPRQSSRMWLATRAAVGGCAPATAAGAPQREARHSCQKGGEAKARPERLQLRGDRPGAVVASEEPRRGASRPMIALHTCVSHATTGRAMTQSKKTSLKD